MNWCIRMFLPLNITGFIQVFLLAGYQHILTDSAPRPVQSKSRDVRLWMCCPLCGQPEPRELETSSPRVAIAKLRTPFFWRFKKSWLCIFCLFLCSVLVGQSTVHNGRELAWGESVAVAVGVGYWWQLTCDIFSFSFWIFWFWCYYRHKLSDSVSSVCVIFLNTHSN